MVDVELERQKLREEFETMYMSLSTEPVAEESFEERLKRLMNRKKLLSVIQSLFEKGKDGDDEEDLNPDSDAAAKGTGGINDFRNKLGANTGTIKKME